MDQEKDKDDKTVMNLMNEQSKTQQFLKKLDGWIPKFAPISVKAYIWTFFVQLCLIYACFEIPVTWTFHIDLTLHSEALYALLTAMINAVCFIDIFVTFRTKIFDHFDRMRIVDDPNIIAEHYVRGWFALDLVTSVPWQLMITDHVENTGFGIIRMLMVVRFYRNMLTFDKQTKQFVNSRKVRACLKLFKLLLCMVLFAHWAGCIWYFVGEETDPSWLDAQGIRDTEDEDENYSTFQKYTFAWYWSVVTLFTTGYGDISATNTVERWVCSVAVLVGTCFFSYFVGALTVLIIDGDKLNAYEMEMVEIAQTFCDDKHLDPRLSRAVLTHTKYYCQNNFALQDPSAVLEILPQHLQDNIQSNIGQRILGQLYMFQSVHSTILGKIALRMRSISCNKKYELFSKGDRARSMVIQRTGICNLRYKNVKNKKEDRIIALHRGHLFGENGFIAPKREMSAKCETWSEFYVLYIADVVSVLEDEYPSTWTKRLKVIQKAVKRKLKIVKYEKTEDFLWIDFKKKPRRQSDAFLTHQSTIKSKVVRKKKQDFDAPEELVKTSSVGELIGLTRSKSEHRDHMLVVAYYKETGKDFSEHTFGGSGNYTLTPVAGVDEQLDNDYGDIVSGVDLTDSDEEKGNDDEEDLEGDDDMDGDDLILVGVGKGNETPKPTVQPKKRGFGMGGKVVSGNRGTNVGKHAKQSSRNALEMTELANIVADDGVNGVLDLVNESDDDDLDDFVNDTLNQAEEDSFHD